LLANNLRVDGWRVRLLDLLPDRNVGLKELGNSWQDLALSARPVITNKLRFIVSELQSGSYSLSVIREIFNDLLLKEAANKPLRSKIFSVTDKGNRRSNNEDHHYPTQLDLYVLPVNYNQNLANSLMMVCDGMGGHDSGEVASYLAIESLKVQIKMFLLEMAKNYELLEPEMVKESLATIIRVANNVIYSRNEAEGKNQQYSMGTTLVMALQLPQLGIFGNSHEVYVANVGDSRAYWITKNGCQRLTVDDDWITKGVKLGKSFYRQALQNPRYGRLTQALGVRDSAYIEPNIQRFMVVEDGILLLCSDGLSDYDFLETYWRQFFPDVLENKVSLQEAMESLLSLAIAKNGHDNITIVANYYGVSPQESVVVNLGVGDLETNHVLQADIPDASSLVLAASSRVRFNEEIIEGELEEMAESEDFDWKWWLSIVMAVVVGMSSYMVTQWALESEFTPPLIKDVPMQQ
jgi:protein phosphatase